MAYHIESAVGGQRAMNAGAWSTCSLPCTRTRVQGMVLPSVNLGLPTSVNLIKIVPHRHA